jgi:glycerophosphoryl diester phosphodiesterase
MSLSAVTDSETDSVSDTARGGTAPGSAPGADPGPGNALLRRLDGERQPPLVIAHRGYSSVAPENTMPAFEAAALSGASWIECDVQTTSDGVPVLVHDRKVDRTTDGSGKVRELSSEEIAVLDGGVKFSEVFSGTPVPSLRELLDLLAKHQGVNLLLEIKGGNTAEDVARIITELSETGMVPRTIVQSFSLPVVTAALDRRAELAPGLRVGLLRERFDEDPAAVAAELGVVTYNPEFPAVLAEPEKVAALHAIGVAVMPWTSDGAEEWAGLEIAGVDGIITNRPAALDGWLEALRQQG